MGRNPRKPNATREAAFAILSQCVAGRTHKLARFIDGIFNEELRSVGLRNTQLTLLSVLGYMDASAPMLGKILVMDRSTLSRNLRLLRERGLVAEASPAGSRGDREPSPPASRRFTLTADGKRKVRQALRAWERAQARARDELGDEGVSALRGLGDSVGWLPDD